jgi:hypothetical protein
LISAGVFGYPLREAIRIASEEIKEFLKINEMDVYLVVYHPDKIRLSQLKEDPVEQYLNSHEMFSMHDNLDFVTLSKEDKKSLSKKKKNDFNEVVKFENKLVQLQEHVSNSQESFAKLLFRKIDERGFKDSEVYKKKLIWIEDYFQRLEAMKSINLANLLQ